MKRTFIPCLLLISLSLVRSASIAGQEAARKLPLAAPVLSPAVCGAGTYLLSLGTQSLGRETFEIKCAGDGGFSARASTKMDIPGAAMDLNTTIESDRSGMPIAFSMKGSGGAQTFDQVVTISKEVATVVSGGEKRDVPYSGAALFHPNVTVSYQFLLARYDVEKGGAQKITIFPATEVTLERTARDEIQLPGIVANKPVSFDRYSLQLGPATIVLWTDDKGRLAVLYVPVQNVNAAREDYQPFVQPLRAALAAAVKGLAHDYTVGAGAPFSAEEVKVKAKDFTLAGTLLLPKNATGRVPAVITVTGSGQQTRDSEINLPGLEGYRPFRQIAEAVGNQGIAVLRCDDRGVVVVHRFPKQVRAALCAIETASGTSDPQVSDGGYPFARAHLASPLLLFSRWTFPGV